ncbi:MAG TPA: transporter [Vicinamibacterales bacterium]|nr:transporter [Vicinamibacterales bacterium]
MIPKVVTALITTGVMLLPARASAHTLLSELLVKVLLSDIVLAPPQGPFSSHEAHFQPIIGGDVAAGFEINQLEVPLAINSIIAGQLATIPLGSSSGGFSYTFDPTLGTFSRESSTFGSAFVERALTAGRGRWNIGFNFQRATYDTLEGKDLDNDVKVYLVHQDCCGTPNAPGVPPNPFFEGDVIENTLSLDLTSSTFSAFLTYGITDRLDFGVVVPVVTINMRATVLASVVRLATAASPGIHQFEGGLSEQRFEESARARGLGDMLLRGKFRFLDTPGGGLALGVDVRLPTGDSEQLLGTGGTQVETSLIASMESGKLSPHVNLGYSFASGGGSDPLSVTPEASDEFTYAAGFDMALHERLTFSTDVLGRTLRDIGRLVPVARQFPFVTQSGDFGTATFEEFSLRPGDLNLVVGAAGIRFNPRGSFLISAQALIPITKSGLRDRITPVIGIDYSF